MIFLSSHQRDRDIALYNANVPVSLWVEWQKGLSLKCPSNVPFMSLCENGSKCREYKNEVAP